MDLIILESTSETGVGLLGCIFHPAHSESREEYFGTWRSSSPFAANRLLEPLYQQWLLRSQPHFLSAIKAGCILQTSIRYVAVVCTEVINMIDFILYVMSPCHDNQNPYIMRIVFPYQEPKIFLLWTFHLSPSRNKYQISSFFLISGWTFTGDNLYTLYTQQIPNYIPDERTGGQIPTVSQVRKKWNSACNDAINQKNLESTL